MAASSTPFDQRQRLFELLRRHVRVEDTNLTDDQLVRSVYARYVIDRDLALIDPNE